MLTICISRRWRIMSVNKFTIILSCVLLILSYCGCGRSSPQIARLTKDSVVLAFGDSLTSGVGAPAKDSYPSILEAKTGYRVVNAGVPGELTEAGLTRLPGLLEKHKPNLVVLCHGGNDLLQRTNQAQIIRNLKRMIELIKSYGTDVILIGVPSPGIRLKTASFYQKIAREYDIPYENNIVSDIVSDPSLRSDFVHPNSNGYRQLAESVAELIEESVW